MRKLSLIVVLLVVACSAFAQDKAKGFFGGYHWSTLPNRDDIAADDTKLTYKTTFAYAGGFEKLNWVHNNFGLGFQVGYHQVGQEYSGADTLYKTTFAAKTTLNYFKVGGFIYFKSFNRYNPTARFKFNSFLGPYISLLPAFTDNYKLYDASAKLISEGSFTLLGYRGGTGSIANFDTKQPIYKLFDFGFVVAPGVQYMITRKFGLAFNIRGDISAEGIENTGNIKKKITNPINPAAEAYDHWGNLYAKYNVFNPYNIPGVKKDPFDTRPTTKALTIGAYLTARWYMEPQYN